MIWLFFTLWILSEALRVYYFLSYQKSLDKQIDRLMDLQSENARLKMLLALQKESSD